MVSSPPTKLYLMSTQGSLGACQSLCFSCLTDHRMLRKLQETLVTKLPGYGLPRLNELFWNEHVLCSELTDHLFNNSRVLLSGIKLRCQSWILFILKTRTFCSLWLFGPFSFLPPILQALSLQCLQDQPVASSFWNSQPEPNHSSSQERGVGVRPELLWPGALFTHCCDLGN